MIDMQVVDNFVNRIKVNDLDLVKVEVDGNGDYIKVFDSEADFQRVKKAVLACRAYYDNVIDCGLNFIVVRDTEYIDGNKVSVQILSEVGDLGYGVNVKVSIKNLEYFYNGDLRVFLSYSTYKDFLNSVAVDK